MRTVDHAIGFARFIGQYRRFLAAPLTLEGARATIRRRLEERESRFLDTAETCIYGNPTSPYLPLLSLAGCEYGDLAHMVSRDGLTASLQALREAGVCFSFEEFKGRTPVVRDGQEIPLEPRAFDNPRLQASFRGESGGSTGRATQVFVDLRHVAASAPVAMVYRDMHGVLDKPAGMWLGVLPDPTGSFNLLRQAAFGRIPAAWFTPATYRGASWRERLFTHSLVHLGRQFGTPVPTPETLSLGEELRAAQWMADVQVPAGGGAFFCHPSKALRIAAAAREADISLEGVHFIIGGEPVTAGKVRGIESAGAVHQPLYALSEIGTVGEGCPRSEHRDEVHVNADAIAVIQAERRVAGFDLTVGSFLFTSLLGTTPKILLNVEADDFGVLEERRCSCALGSLGFRTVLRHIRSFSKLTAEGTTLVGTDLERILETELPARFGGGALDYQLVEEEDADGFTCLRLLIHPRVRIEDEHVVTEYLLKAAGSSASVLAAAGAMSIERAEPFLTGRGKFMPLHLIERDG